jgi:hypothetical protein
MMSSGPYFATQARRPARQQEFVLIKMISSYQKPQGGGPTAYCLLAARRANCQTSSCHGPTGGATGGDRRGGVGCQPRAHPAGRRHQTCRCGARCSPKTQNTRPTSNCNQSLAEPRDPAGPLPSSSGVCGGGIVWTDHHNPGEGIGRTHSAVHAIRRFAMHLGGC